jgi:hypothetical protein
MIPLVLKQARARDIGETRCDLPPRNVGLSKIKLHHRGIRLALSLIQYSGRPISFAENVDDRTRIKKRIGRT